MEFATKRFNGAALAAAGLRALIRLEMTSLSNAKALKTDFDARGRRLHPFKRVV